MLLLLFFNRTSTGFPLISGATITAIYWKIGRSPSCIGFTGVPRLYTVDYYSTKQEGQDRPERPSRNVLLKIPVLVVQNRREPIAPQEMYY